MDKSDTEQRLRDSIGREPRTTQMLRQSQPPDRLKAWMIVVALGAPIVLSLAGSVVSPLVAGVFLEFASKPGGPVDLVWMITIISGMFFVAERVLYIVNILKKHIETEHRAMLSLYKMVQAQETRMHALAPSLDRLARVLEERLMSPEKFADAVKRANKSALAEQDAERKKVMEEGGEIEPPHLTPILDRFIGVMERLEAKLPKENGRK